MRIDKYLKNTRIIKRRTVAKEACEQGRIFINDKMSKPGSEVTEGDIIKISFASKTLQIEVLDTMDSQRKEDAEKMYRVIETVQEEV